MTDQFSIITTLVTGFGLALVFGCLAERFLKTPALVGYIIAGVSVSLFPLLPSVDRGVTQQFADIGVMLLMFGVGLHFSVADLVKVKGVAVTGAVLQMAASGAAGTAVALLAWDWALPNAIVFGMTLSCASTVVVMKALELRKLAVTPSGQVAIGWLVVQDLVTVFIMVCLPLVAQVTQGEGPIDPKLIAISLAKTLLGVAVFVAGMLVVGKRVFPWMLRRVALLGSRELFTLCVLAIAIGIAYGAGAIFSVSYALGAFFAGMVMRESSFAHRAARNCLPLQDAFSVLFFISVGLMLDLHVFVNEPFAVLAVVFIIMFITSSVSALLVLLLGWPLDTALVMGACVSQLGEFSFILCGQGITLGIASPETMSIVVAASIITIAVNPLMFQLVPHVKRLLVTRYPHFRRMADRVSPLATGKPKTTKGHVLIAGVNEVVLTLLPKLERRGIDFTCFVSTDEAAAAVNAYEHGSAIVGDPSDPEILDKGHIHTAQVLVLPSADLVFNKAVIQAARGIRFDCPIVVRIESSENRRSVPSDENTRILCDSDISAEGIGVAVGDAFGFGDDLRRAKAKALAKAVGDLEEDDDDESGDESADMIAQARAEAAAHAEQHPASRRIIARIKAWFAEHRAKRAEAKAERKAAREAEKAAKAAQAAQPDEAGHAEQAAAPDESAEKTESVPQQAGEAKPSEAEVADVKAEDAPVEAPEAPAAIEKPVAAESAAEVKEAEAEVPPVRSEVKAEAPAPTAEPSEADEAPAVAPESRKPSAAAAATAVLAGMKDKLGKISFKEKLDNLDVKETIGKLDVKGKIESLNVKGKVEKLDVKGRIHRFDFGRKLEKFKDAEVRKWLPKFGKSRKEK